MTSPSERTATSDSAGSHAVLARSQSTRGASTGRSSPGRVNAAAVTARIASASAGVSRRISMSGSAGDAGRAEELLEVGVQGRSRGDAKLVVQPDHGGLLVAAQPQVDLGGAGVGAQHVAELLDHRGDALGDREL